MEGRGCFPLDLPPGPARGRSRRSVFTSANVCTRPRAIISSPSLSASARDAACPLMCSHETASPPMKQDGNTTLDLGTFRSRIYERDEDHCESHGK